MTFVPLFDKDDKDYQGGLYNGVQLNRIDSQHRHGDQKIALIYSFTGIDFFNWPYAFPLVLLTFMAMGWSLHRNISALVAAKDHEDKALDAAIM